MGILWKFDAECACTDELNANRALCCQDPSKRRILTKSKCPSSSSTSVKSLSFVKSPVRKGTKAYKFDLNFCDPEPPAGSKRAELSLDREGQYGETHFYAISHRLPGSWQNDKTQVVITQWHGPAKSVQPEEEVRFTLNVTGNPPMFELRNCLTTPTTIYPLRQAVKDKWVDFVFMFKWHVKDGLFAAWINKEQVLSHGPLPTCYVEPSDAYPTNANNFKRGIYKAVWKGNPGSSDSRHITLFCDEICIGDHNSGVDEVSPK